MYEFYRISYKMRYLSTETLRELTKWNCITEQEYKEITGEDYVEP